MVSDALAGLWNIIRGISQGVSEGIAEERPAVSTMRSRGGGSSRREELEKQFYQPRQATPTQNQPAIRSASRPQNPPAKQDPEYHDLGDY